MPVFHSLSKKPLLKSSYTFAVASDPEGTGCESRECEVLPHADVGFTDFKI